MAESVSKLTTMGRTTCSSRDDLLSRTVLHCRQEFGPTRPRLLKRGAFQWCITPSRLWAGSETLHGSHLLLISPEQQQGHDAEHAIRDCLRSPNPCQGEHAGCQHEYR